MVYARTVKGETLTLGVSGMLWKRSLVMYDVETDSLWSHILGRAMAGPLAGTQLTMLPGQMLTWGQWRRRYPETTVLNISRTAPVYTREFYSEPAQFVYGWAAGRSRYHTPMPLLERIPVQNLDLPEEFVVVVFDRASSAAQVFSRVVDGQTLSFLPHGRGNLRDVETKSVWNGLSGEALSGPLQGTRLRTLLGMISYRRAWDDFYPDSQEILPPE